MGTSAKVATLLETTIAVGILATVAGGTLGVSAMATRAAAGAAERAALQSAAEREMRVALDVLKYQGGALAPAAVSTSLPLAGASPLPVQMSVQSAVRADGTTSVTIGVVSTSDSTERTILYGTLDRRAPLPGTVLRAPGLVPAPTGAP